VSVFTFGKKEKAGFVAPLMANHLLKNTAYTLDFLMEINPSPTMAVPSSNMIFASGTETEPDEKVKTEPNELPVKFQNPGVSSNPPAYKMLGENACRTKLTY
jgi:hypothetical protein